jgi:hypothetical protein
VLFTECCLLSADCFSVEILCNQPIDTTASRTIFLKGFEDGWILNGSCWTENAPLRRKRESVFDNLVERASREIPVFS